MSAQVSPTPIGQTLVSQGLISADQLAIALREQQRTGQTLGRLLIELGFISETILRDALSASLGHAAVDLSRASVDPAALQRIPGDFALRHKLLSLDLDERGKRLTVACANPNDIIAIDRLRGLFEEALSIEIVFAGEAEIIAAIDRYYGHELSIDGILHEIETGEIDFASLAIDANQYSHPVVRLINALLTDAVKRTASDIHFEPELGFLRIRYRIDGILRQVRSLHRSYWDSMAVRLKVISEMNIAEARAPQDGRFSLNIGGRNIDFRCAVQPVIHGENIVVRILDRQRGIMPLAQLGLDVPRQQQLRQMLTRPSGIILVTGPTGSGKSTTLYSLLQEISTERINIMTLEDPVEYPCALIRQTSLADAVKLDFANGIRALMRQDPDVILVGEIRDEETASMAFRAAMTGHQVYSTLHCNSVLGAIPRLLDIGVSPAIMAGNMIGIIAQRLIRVLCPHCRIAYRAREDEQALLQAHQLASTNPLYRPGSCAHCDFQGYRGRRAIMELLRIDAGFEELIAARTGLRELREYVHGKGFRPLIVSALQYLIDGTTSLAEIARVVDLSEFIQSAETVVEAQ